MNLEKLNLVELNAQEVQETEGGIWPLVVAAATYFLVETVTNPVSSHTAFSNGIKAGSNAAK